MSKIEFNPRKTRHKEYLERRLTELHRQIFDDSLFVINNHDADFQGLLEKRRQQIKTNVSLHGKYKRRLKLLNL